MPSFKKSVEASILKRRKTREEYLEMIANFTVADFLTVEEAEELLVLLDKEFPEEEPNEE